MWLVYLLLAFNILLLILNFRSLRITKKLNQRYYQMINEFYLKEVKNVSNTHH
jgi:hypothetical protein